MASTVEQLKENKGKVALLAGLLVACSIVAWINFKPQTAKVPVTPNTAPISEEEKKVGEEQQKKIQQIEKTRPSSGA